MALEKAYLAIDGGEQIPVLFNPNQYSLDRSNQIAELGIPGAAAPVLQYVHGNTGTLSMDLFFDTYEQQSDVRRYTDKVYGLLGIQRDTHAPPLLTFTWGNFHFRCVLERVSGRFTVFLADGTPVRATLSVSLKEYVDLEDASRGNPLESADHDKTHAVKRGDSLSSLAAVEYGDPAQWRTIAVANGIDNPRLLTPGTVLKLPPLR